MTLTGIANENEFYTEHYVHSILEGDLRELFSKWSALSEPPYEAIKKLRGPYDQMTRELGRTSGAAARLECRRPWFAHFFEALGYQLAPKTRELEGGVHIPLAGEITRRSGEPELWILETLEPNAEPADPLTLPFLPEQVMGDIPDSSRLPAADLETVITKYVFAAAEPPALGAAVQHRPGPPPGSQQVGAEAHAALRHRRDPGEPGRRPTASHRRAAAP